MAVCQYFLRGTCRFGNTCRNEHPANPRSGFGNQSWSNNNNTTNAQSATKQTLALFTQDSLKSDLTSDKPIWPLSTFGPAKYEPNLVSNLDESMEELRLRAVIALKAGNVNEYTTYEAKRIEAANEAYNNARNNLAQVYQTALTQSNRPTNATTSTPSPFASATNLTGYTSPSLKSNLFTQPTFGQSSFGVKSPTQPSASPSVFGQPSTLGGNKPGGTTTGGGFGAFAGGGASSLAAAAAAMKPSGQGGTGGGGAFSTFAGQQPSAFGGGAANITSGSGSVFGTGGPLGGGAPSTVFGQPQNQQQQLPRQITSAFGTIQNQPTSVFGQPQPQQTQPQAQPLQPLQPPQQGGGFGAFANQQQRQPQSVFGGGSRDGGGAAPQPQPQAQSSFGIRPQQPQSAFGAPPQEPQSAFGAPPPQPQSAFGALPQQPQSAFGAPQSAFGSTSTQPQSVFGGVGGGGNLLNPPSVFSSISTPFNAPASSQPQQQSPFGLDANLTNLFTSTANIQINPFNHTTIAPTTKPTTQNPLTNPTSKPDFLSALTRARPTPGKSPYDKTLPPNYAENLPQHAIDAFKNQKFEFGMVPDWVPPVELR